MSGPIFSGLQTLLVMTAGSGTLNYLNYQSNAGLAPVLASKSVTVTGNAESSWVLAFSYTFERFAFTWQGSGGATYRIGNSLQTFPVGTNWNNASLVAWTSSVVTNANVTSIAAGLTVSSNCNAFVVPPPI